MLELQTFLLLEELLVKIIFCVHICWYISILLHLIFFVLDIILHVSSQPELELIKISFNP